MARTNKIRLRYGENPHQEAWVQLDSSYKGQSVLNKPLHGKPMGYNNIQDANVALEVLLDFCNRATAVVIKHKNPCGLATGKNIEQAFENAWLGDEVSAFGSIVGFSQPVNGKTIRLLKGKFVEILVAPSYEDAALNWIKSKSSKKEIRIIATGSLKNAPSFIEEHSIRGCKISQTYDNKLYLCNTSDELLGKPKTTLESNSGIEYQVGTVTEKKFKNGMQGLIEFSITAGKHTRSNAIVLAYEYDNGQYRVLGMGAGQPNRLDSVEKLAFTKAKENLMRQFFREEGLDYAMTMAKLTGDKAFGNRLPERIEKYTAKILSSEKVVLFSDAFFPKSDAVIAAAESGVRYIVCPGGSKADEDIIKAANKKGVAMIFTGIRHFRH